MSSEEVTPPEPGTVVMPDEGEFKLTDPKAMRALAHPVRIALMELLEVTPTLTATQASEALGESPANCAFHLRTLAKYGFVREAGGGKGRERPWTGAHRSINVTIAQKDEQAGLAASALAHVWQDRQLERIRRVLSADSWPEGWEDAARSSDNVRFLTAQEAVSVSDEFRAILDRYEGRLRDPASRPQGALPVEFAYYMFPLTELAGLGSGGGGSDQVSTSDERANQHDNEDNEDNEEEL